MIINYYPILIMQVIISIIVLLIQKKSLNYSVYFKLIVVNLTVGIIGLYIGLIPLTDVHLFSVSPNLIPFRDIKLNIIDIVFLTFPFTLLTIFLSLLFGIRNSYKSIFVALGLSVFIQFFAYAIQSQIAEITFILVQLMGILVGYVLYILILKKIKIEINTTD